MKYFSSLGRKANNIQSGFLLDDMSTVMTSTFQTEMGSMLRETKTVEDTYPGYKRG